VVLLVAGYHRVTALQVSVSTASRVNSCGWQTTAHGIVEYTSRYFALENVETKAWTPTWVQIGTRPVFNVRSAGCPCDSRVCCVTALVLRDGMGLRARSMPESYANEQITRTVGFEVSTAVTMKIAVF
jgi:hypothetical protein